MQENWSHLWCLIHPIKGFLQSLPSKESVSEIQTFQRSPPHKDHSLSEYPAGTSVNNFERFWDGLIHTQKVYRHSIVKFSVSPWLIQIWSFCLGTGICLYHCPQLLHDFWLCPSFFGIGTLAVYCAPKQFWHFIAPCFGRSSKTWTLPLSPLAADSPFSQNFILSWLVLWGSFQVNSKTN